MSVELPEKDVDGEVQYGKETETDWIEYVCYAQSVEATRDDGLPTIGIKFAAGRDDAVVEDLPRMDLACLDKFTAEHSLLKVGVELTGEARPL